MDAMTCGTICELLAQGGEPLHRQTLEGWVRRGIVRPADHDDHGRRLYRALDVLALIVARGLRDAHIDLSVACAVGGWIRRQDLDELRGAVTQGRTHLAIIDGRPCPELYPRASIMEGIAQRKDALRRAGATVVVVDVAAAVARLEEALDERG